MDRNDSPSSFAVDFIGIGAPRCGTTWIYRCIEEHPAVAGAFVKEVGFFSDAEEYAQGLDGYARYFKDRQPGMCTGEFTPMYLSDPAVPARIRALLPDVKLIVSLRNPVDALHSFYNFRQARGRHDFESFEAFLKEDPEEIENWKYMQQLRPYLDNFPRENILILVFEDIAEDPRQFMRNVFEFIGVDPSFVPTLVDQRVNIGNRSRVFFLSRLMLRVMESLRRTRIGEKLVHRLFQSRLRAQADKLFERKQQTGARDKSRPEISDDTRRMLRATFETDITELESLLQRELKSWR